MRPKEHVASFVVAFSAGMLSGIWWPDNWIAGGTAGMLTLLIVPLLSRKLGLFQ